MDFGEQVLLAILLAFVGGVALGRLWARLAPTNRSNSPPSGSASMHFLLGLDLLASRELDRAVSELTKAARENTEAIEIYLVLGNLLRDKGQLERAIQIHQTILHRPGLSRSERAHTLLCLGMDFKRAGFRNRAVDTLHEVVKLEPNHAYALANLSKIYEEEQEWEKALEIQQRLGRVTGEPDSTLLAFLYDRIAQAAWRGADGPRAARLFEESIRADRRLPPAYLHYGDMLESQGRLEEAEAQWRRLAEEAPSNAHLAFERLERVRKQLGRQERMQALYEDVIHRDEKDWRAHVALARLRYAQGHSEKAFALLLQAVKNNPHAFAVHLEIWNLLDRDDGRGERLRRYLREVSSSVFFVDPYVCIKCGYRANGVLWRCPHCGQWNTFVEERLESDPTED